MTAADVESRTAVPEPRSAQPERIPAGAGDDPLAFFVASHAAHLKLCDMLEDIADSLPKDYDRRMCFRAAMALRTDVALHHLDEERGLFPLLRTRLGADAARLTASLARLEGEHYSDEGFSEEVIEILDSMARGAPNHASETTGYMLRGFFEGLRRHIAFENEVILPQASLVFTPQDLDTLRAIIAQNREKAPRALFPKGACGDTLEQIYKAG